MTAAEGTGFFGLVGHIPLDTDAFMRAMDAAVLRLLQRNAEA